MSNHSWRRGLAITAIALFLFCLVGYAVWESQSSNASVDSDIADTTDDGLATDVPAAQQALSVNPEDVPVEFCNDLIVENDGKLLTLDDGTVTPYFILGSIQEVGKDDNERLWSDAVNVPLSPQTLEEEQAVICQDPAQAAMVMNGMQKVMIGNKSVADLNADWMKAQGSPRAISQWATNCISDDEDVHLKCAQKMATMAYLLGQFHDDGVVRATTKWNYHLTGPVAGKVPQFGMNPKQEKNAFFVGLSYTTKTGGVCVRVGFNVGITSKNGGDQRFAGLACKSTPPPAAKCVGDDCNPGNPGCKHDCVPPTNPPGTPPTNPPTNPPSSCPCVDPTDVIQDVPDAPDNNAPSQEPSAQPTVPVNTANPADPTPGGYNGGSPSQPGTTAPPSHIPEEPSDGPTHTGDPGGF